MSNVESIWEDEYTDVIEIGENAIMEEIWKIDIKHIHWSMVLFICL